MELPQMRFRYSYPFISREIPGVNIVSITNRNNDPSALPRCQCFYCCVWGGDAIPPRPSSQLQYSYSSLPSPGNPVTGFDCSCCSPELRDRDAKILKEHKTKQRPHCRICDKTFARVSTLKIHLRIHSGEKPYQCTYCAKAFVQSANLVAHLRTHTGEKPYQCYICEKRFSQSSSVKTHIRTHTGERPFPCVQCGKCFSDRSTLSKHRRVHQKMKTELRKDCCIADIHAEFRSNAI